MPFSDRGHLAVLPAVTDDTADDTATVTAVTLGTVNGTHCSSCRSTRGTVRRSGLPESIGNRSPICQGRDFTGWTGYRPQSPAPVTVTHSSDCWVTHTVTVPVQ